MNVHLKSIFYIYHGIAFGIMPPIIPFSPKNPLLSGIELAYTVIVVVIFISVYLMTREMYHLTRHKGIRHFRIAFLYFSLSYSFFFILHLMMFSNWNPGFMLKRGYLWLFSMIPLSYFSTLAIFHLGYSTVWKGIDEKKFIWLSVSVAVILSFIVVLLRAPLILLFFQAFLLASIVIVVFRKQSKKMHQMKLMYFLIAAFWVMNLIALGPSKILKPDLRLIFQVISIVISGILLYRVMRWVR